MSYPQARPTEIDRVIHRHTPALPRPPLWGQPGEAEAERPDTRLYQILKLDVYLMACTMGYLGLPFLTLVNPPPPPTISDESPILFTHDYLLSNTLDNQPHREQYPGITWVSRAALIGVL